MSDGHDFAASESVHGCRIIHHLLTLPEYWDATAAGLKLFEVRKDDREPRFEVGDSVVLCRCAASEQCANRHLEFTISYVLRDVAWVLPGYCVLGHRLLKTCELWDDVTWKN